MKRHHEMDAARAFAMSLGIVLHGTFFVLPTEFWLFVEDWAKETPTASNPYVYIFSAIHGFRMPVFFLISGFFAALMWRKRGSQGLISHRLRRIAFPLAVCLITFLPVSYWLSFQEEPSLRGWLLIWTENLMHFWFLWQLLLITAVFMVGLELGLRFRNRLWYLLIPVAACSQYLMTDGLLGADLSEHLIPDLNVLAYNFTFFAFGVFLYQRNIEVRRWWAWLLIPALAVFFPLGLVSLYPHLFIEAEVIWIRVISAVLVSAFAWLMCFGLLGFFLWIAGRERYWIRYASDSAYWFYIAHFPLVVAAQMLLVNLPLNVHLEVVLMLVGVGAILLFTYEFGVRYTIVGRVLNGPRSRNPR